MDKSQYCWLKLGTQSVLEVGGNQLATLLGKREQNLANGFGKLTSVFWKILYGEQGWRRV